MELEVFSEFRSKGEAIGDFGNDRIRGLECKVEGGVMVSNSNRPWLLMELEILGDFKSWGEAIVDFGVDCIRGLECKVEERVIVSNSNPAWLLTGDAVQHFKLSFEEARGQARHQGGSRGVWSDIRYA